MQFMDSCKGPFIMKLRKISIRLFTCLRLKKGGFSVLPSPPENECWELTFWILGFHSTFRLFTLYRRSEPVRSPGPKE